MDELLALMEDEPPPPPPPPQQQRQDAVEASSQMDELLSLMNSDETTTCTESSPRPSSSRSREHYSERNDASSRLVTPSTHNAPPNRTTTTSSNHGSSNNKLPEANNVEDKLGFRMLNHQIPSLDLMEMIQDRTPFYVSPVQLSAMSLQTLTRLLIDPPQIIDRATVSGKTQVLTVGIVFSNSGTKMSARGGAFTVLTIGSSLASGPCVTVFLFGAAYGQYCRSCVPGKVIALDYPKLLPLKEPETNSNNKSYNNNTAVSLSVHDAQQLKMVATARDYGRCQAKTTTRTKQANGSWKVFHDGSCKNHVDKRQGEFCEKHRQQKYRNSSNNTATGGGSSTLNNKGSKQTFMQQLRSESLPTTSHRQNHLTNGTQLSMINNSNANRFLNGSQLNNGRAGTIVANGGRSIPMHMKKESLSSGRILSNQSVARNNSNNRLMNGKGPKQPSNASAIGMDRGDRQPKKRCIVGAGDWLQDATKTRKAVTSTNSTTDSNKKRRKAKINTSGGGFDGAVAVPKPSRLFQVRGQPQAFMEKTPRLPAILSDQNPPKQARLLEKQMELAQRLKENSDPCGKAKTPTTTRRPTSASIKKTLAGGGGSVKSRLPGQQKAAAPLSAKSFLDEMLSIDDRDKVLNAKSRFANEADAEQYAQSRQRVALLEEQETIKEKKNTNKEDDNKKLKVEWICKTCQSKFPSKPMRCLQAKHQVRRHRSVVASLSKADERTKLHRASAEEGGLHLGSGLDWSSTWSRFS